MSTPSSKAEASTPYHHGDLRRSLLDGANAILAETGRWDFSLREVARRAGVSHNAPYRHFADKEELLAAIGVVGYQALHERTSIAAQGACGAVDKLAATGRAYIQFGIDNPALYRLMFGQALPSSDSLPLALQQAVAVARKDLRDVVETGARDGAFNLDPDDAAEVTVATVAAWSFVHGFTLLTIDQVVRRDTEDEMVNDLAARVVTLFVAGLQSNLSASRSNAA